MGSGFFTQIFCDKFFVLIRLTCSPPKVAAATTRLWLCSHCTPDPRRGHYLRPRCYPPAILPRAQQLSDDLRRISITGLVGRYTIYMATCSRHRTDGSGGGVRVGVPLRAGEGAELTSCLGFSAGGTTLCPARREGLLCLATGVAARTAPASTGPVSTGFWSVSSVVNIDVPICLTIDCLGAQKRAAAHN